MNPVTIQNQTYNTVKKVGRKVPASITPQSPDELLNTLADIIIERILEVSKKGVFPESIKENV